MPCPSNWPTPDATLARDPQSKKVDFLYAPTENPKSESKPQWPPRACRYRGDLDAARREVSNKDLHDAVMDHVIRPIVPAAMLDRNTKIQHQSDRALCHWRPDGDAGVTGRKIIVDSYGGYSRHQAAARFPRQGSFQGDRSACYWRGKYRQEHVSAGLARKAKCNSGVRHWRGGAGFRLVDGIWHENIPEERITALVRENFSLTRRELSRAGFAPPDLTNQPLPTDLLAALARASPEERTDRAAALRKDAGLGSNVSARRRSRPRAFKRRISSTLARHIAISASAIDPKKLRIRGASLMAIAEMKKGGREGYFAGRCRQAQIKWPRSRCRCSKSFASACERAAPEGIAARQLCLHVTSETANLSDLLARQAARK